MLNICEENKCAGCMACIDICHIGAIQIKDEIFAYNAVIDNSKCVDCGACRRICPNNNPVKSFSPQKWYQGWAKNEKIRAGGSSGGAASAIAFNFIQNGGYVCSCIFKNGEFVFEIVNNIDDLSRFRGSKYVKSDPSGIYNRILALLKDNGKVLFIGLPCQVAAVRSFVGKNDRLLYTVELICHGTPSPKVLEIYLKQHGYNLDELREISFRYKNNFRLKPVTKSGMQDSYLMAFLEGMSFTENCYSCQYAKNVRTGDITLGDSWGSKLSKEEIHKGISLILCQTHKGKELLEQANLHLEEIDKESAVRRNGQLTQPSSLHKYRNVFMEQLKENESFDKLVVRYLPKRVMRQSVKFLLTKLKILRRGGYRITVALDNQTF